MSALADFAHKLGSESRELKIGQSFFNDADPIFHTIRYDFVPASIDPNKTSAVDIGQNGKVTVTMPNVEGSGTTESVYQGQRKAHQKECVLVFDPETGDMTLEKLNTSMIVKKARLRQEDLTGKSLALNKNSNGSFVSPVTTSSSIHSQSKSSIDKKTSSGNILPIASSSSLKTGQSVPNVLKITKQSSPQHSSTLQNSSLSQLRSNGLQPKTPSPPSMPIFNTNKGSLLRNSEYSSDWNNLSKTKQQEVKVNEPSNKSNSRSQSNSITHINRLSEESSSDSSEVGNFVDESSSSGSSSYEEDSVGEKNTSVANSRPNALSMPSLSMPISSFLGFSDSLSHRSQNASSGALKSPSLVASDLKKSALSEDSESSDDCSNRRHKKATNESKLAGSTSMKIESVPVGSSVFLSNENKSFSDSMPKFNGSTSTATFSSLPKYSQLNLDLQLSESGSDSDD